MLKHEAAKQHLRRLAAHGKPGDKLPTEEELCERLGISRTTAVRAFRDLEIEGLVSRKQGSGSFVAERGSLSPETVRVSGRPSVPERPYLEAALADLAAAQPNIKVVFLESDADGSPVVVRVIGALAGEAGDELVELKSEWKAEVNWRDLEPVVTDVFSPAGRAVAVPRCFSPVVLFYNADLIEQAGCPLPDSTWTLDDLERVAVKVGERSGDVCGLGLPLEFPMLLPFIWSSGGEVFSSNGRVPTFSDPAVIEGLCRVRRLAATSPLETDAPQMGKEMEAFYEGRAAMFLWGGILAARLEGNTAFRWGVAPFPRGRRHVTLLFSEGYGIRRNAASPETAWELVKALSSPASQARLMDLGVRLPANRSVWRDDWVTNLFRRELNSARLAREAGTTEVRYLVDAELEALWRSDEPVERICQRIDHGVRMIMRGRERSRVRGGASLEVAG